MDFDTLILSLENDFKTWKENKAKQAKIDLTDVLTSHKALDQSRAMAAARDRAERTMYAYIRQQISGSQEAVERA